MCDERGLLSAIFTHGNAFALVPARTFTTLHWTLLCWVGGALSWCHGLASSACPGGGGGCGLMGLYTSHMRTAVDCKACTRLCVLGSVPPESMIVHVVIRRTQLRRRILLALASGAASGACSRISVALGLPAMATLTPCWHLVGTQKHGASAKEEVTSVCCVPLASWQVLGMVGSMVHQRTLQEVYSVDSTAHSAVVLNQRKHRYRHGMHVGTWWCVWALSSPLAVVILLSNPSTPSASPTHALFAAGSS